MKKRERNFVRCWKIVRSIAKVQSDSKIASNMAFLIKGVIIHLEIFYSKFETGVDFFFIMSKRLIK